MIEKLEKQNTWGECLEKLNEVIDDVNAIQKEREAERFEIQAWIGILEAVRKSVNIHEKQIDELQMKLEPEKCETPAENMQPNVITMSKDIWHFPSEAPVYCFQCVFYDTASNEYHFGQYSPVFKHFRSGNAGWEHEEVQRFAFAKDIIACLDELARTRKALEIIKKEMSKETMPDFAVIRDALKGVGDE